MATAQSVKAPKKQAPKILNLRAHANVCDHAHLSATDRASRGRPHAGAQLSVSERLTSLLALFTYLAASSLPFNRFSERNTHVCPA